MGRWLKPLLIAGMISLTYAFPASASLVEDRKVCDGGGAAEPQAQACSRLIASGRFKGRDLGVTYNNRGFAYLMMKDAGNALADFEKAIQFVPTLEDAWFGRGRALAARGELQRAITDFNRAMELKPGLARHYVLRGEAFASMGDNQRALTDFEQAIRMEPNNNPFAYHARGAIYRRTGNFDAAIASHDQGLRIHPVDPYAFASRAYAFSEKGDQNRALTDADEALRLNGNLAYAFLVRGLIFSRIGNASRAIADYDQSIRLSQDARAYTWRGLAHEKNGDTLRAWSDYQDALGATVGRKDEHALALRRRSLLVAEDHLRVVRAGEVGKDDPGRVVVAVGERPSEPARPISELGDDPIDAFARLGADEVRGAMDPRHGRDGDSGAPSDLVDRRVPTSPPRA